MVIKKEFEMNYSRALQLESFWILIYIPVFLGYCQSKDLVVSNLEALC